MQRGYLGFIGPRSPGYCIGNPPLNPVFCSNAPETPITRLQATSCGPVHASVMLNGADRDRGRADFPLALTDSHVFL